jgi:hypothetical protein
MQGHIRTATSLCLVLLALSLVGWPADVRVSMPLDGEHSWIRVAPEGCYFQFEHGVPFFPVGYVAPLRATHRGVDAASRAIRSNRHAGLSTSHIQVRRLR